MADNFFGITDTGRVRTNNEDAFIAEKVLQGRYIAACVIDGVGGYEGGEVAAAIARQTILDYFSVPSGDVTTMMREAFVVANEKITAEKQRNPQYESMACVATLAMVDLAAKTFYYTHIGDTRLYLLRDNSLVKISKDQSFVGYLEDSGRITEDEAMQHPKRNEINNAIGFEAQLIAGELETGTSPFLPGDLLLLCSDGLTDLLKSSEIQAVLLGTGTLQAKAKALVQQANERGGKDNITVVLVRNHRKPVLQKATRPAAATLTIPEKKVNEVPADLHPETTKVELPKRRKKNWLTVILALLCAGLAVTVVLLLYKGSGNKSKTGLSVLVENNTEASDLQQAINATKGTSFLISDSLARLPLEVNDTIWIRKDSLHLQGKGMRFLKSSDYDGPAFALSDSCKYVLLENLSFENFDVVVLVRNKALHLKNVRFIGCRVPVQMQMLFPDNVPLTGAVTTVFSSDSLH